MDIIDLARQIGVAIQNDERYIKFRAAEQVTEADEELQSLIGEFNMLKMSINNEISKDNSDKEKVEEFNNRLQEIYQKIISNDNMKKLNDAKAELNTVLMRVNTIIMQSAQGEDPMTTDYREQCGGSCSACSGCH